MFGFWSSLHLISGKEVTSNQLPTCSKLQCFNDQSQSKEFGIVQPRLLAKIFKAQKCTKAPLIVVYLQVTSPQVPSESGFYGGVGLSWNESECSSPHLHCTWTCMCVWRKILCVHACSVTGCFLFRSSLSAVYNRYAGGIQDLWECANLLLGYDH